MELTDEYELLRKEESKQTDLNRTLNSKCDKTGHYRKQCPDSRQPTNRYGGHTYSFWTVDPPFVGGKWSTTAKTAAYHSLADGTCLPSIRIYSISVNYNGKTTNLLASALDSLAEPLILGMDFLHRRQAQLSLDGIPLVQSSLHSHYVPNRLHTIQNPSGRLARSALELQQYDFNIEYRRGKLNVVADALSRNPLSSEEPKNVLASVSLVKKDWYTRKVNQLRASSPPLPDYQEIDGRLFRHIKAKSIISGAPQWKLCVPPASVDQVLYEVHDAVTAGHLGIHKTLKRAQENYYWPGMARDIRHYVRSCTICGKFKVEQMKGAGLMSTMINSHPWETVCMDFIGPFPGLPPGKIGF
ncbi:hypothetical protein EVAR_60626_1 [Eumeta japonica]|uniref:RNA-directed DNA polymerase n=1 Tax=Eumeta variegata TaxID=151549 RepID=A0A4C1TAG2_EUMVA|nr:hypothetical protein EVAR_60626_1 [Eumeta japonica]